MAIIDKIDKLSGTDTRSRNITQAIDKYSGKGPSKNIDDAVKKLDETGTLGKMGIKERIDHLSNAQTMSRNITQSIDRHTNKGPSKNIEEALKWWEDPTPPGPGITEAYAVFDSADGSLVFFRDEPGKYSEGQVEDTKTYFTGVETKTSGFGWTSKNTNVTNIRFEDVAKPISTKEWFSNAGNITSIDGLDKLDTSNVTNMSMMFRGCNTLTSLDVSGFVTSNVTNMSMMFNFCNALTSLDVSGFDTSSVTNLSAMFSGCNTLTSLDVSGFNTSNVTRIDTMFANCNALTSLDVSGFNTSKVTDMYYLFSGCNALKSLDVSDFNTSNVGYLGHMFNDCEALTSLDVSGFDTSNVGDMSYMFSGCNALTSLDVSGFDTSSVPDMDHMFSGCNALTTDITINDISKYSEDMFTNAATTPPAKITLYGEGTVTSADIDTFIASVKDVSPDSNIVNGMQSGNVVFDEDVVWDFDGDNPPSTYVSLTPLIPIEDTSISDAKYIIQISNPQMREYLGGDPMYGEWLDAICTAHRYITSADNRIVLSTTIVHSDGYGGWAFEFADESGEGYVPTKLHLYVEKKD